MQSVLFAEEPTTPIETIRPVIKPDNIYDLDGTLYLCLEMVKTGFGWFQEVDAEGTIMSPHKRIIFKSLNKLKPI